MITAYGNQTYALTAGTHYFVIYSQQHEFSLNGRYTVNLRAISNEEMYNTAPSSAYANWNYTLDDANNTITLNYYTGSKKDVIVYNNYEVNGKLYKTKIASNPSHKTSGYMFAGKSNIGTIKFGNHIDTSSTTDMSCMFYGCSGLFDLDVSNLDTSKVTNMYQMFYNCASITKFDLLNWDTSNVTNMSSMFEGCSSLTLIVSYMDTSKVTTMERMFMGCMSYTSMDLSYFKTGNVRNMFRMFKDCISLRYVNLDLFDTRQVRTFGYMFENCYSLTSLDLRSFYLNGVPQRGNMSYMFCNCRSLPVIYVNNAWCQKLDSPIYNISLFGIVYPWKTSLYMHCKHQAYIL